MNAKISFSSIDARSDPPEWMYRLEDAGFQGWEIVDEGLQKVEGEFKKRVREVHETTNLVHSLHAPLSDINIASVNERMWEESIRQIKESIENTYEFIDDICVVHPGFFSPLSVQMPDTAVQKAISGLTTLCEFAADRGLRIAVENLTSANMLMGRYPDELIQLVRGVNMDNLGVCIDVAHANTTKKLDEFLGITAKAEDVEIIHMHASDNFGADDLHLPLGEGNLDWKKVLNGINNNGYEGIIVLELYSLDGGIESLEFINKVL
ncbi:MAG TPA: sugar phosphate isomerase/epimerase family protein [Candidatus Bathyarchaeia archaeon]|nr:sugar phosphate isomerase/epimerase family protein [Candidatus Bathyarchaeia archaeon]